MNKRKKLILFFYSTIVLCFLVEGAASICESILQSTEAAPRSSKLFAGETKYKLTLIKEGIPKGKFRVSRTGREIVDIDQGAKKITIWNWPDLSQKSQIPILEELSIGESISLYSLKYSNSQDYLTYDQMTGVVKYWDLSLGKTIQRFDVGYKGFVPYAVDFQSKVFITLKKNQSDEVRVWNLKTGESMQKWVMSGYKRPFDISNPGQLRDANSQVRELLLLPDGKSLVIRTLTDKLQIWNYQSGEYLRSIPVNQNGIYSMKVSHNGKFLATAARYGGVKVWDLVNHKLWADITQFDSTAFSVAFSPDDRVLAACGTGRKRNLVIWDIVDNRFMSEIVGLPKDMFISDEKISENSQFILINNDDQTTTPPKKGVSIYSTVTGTLIATISNQYGDFVGNNQIISGYGGEGLKLWKIDTVLPKIADKVINVN